MTIKVMKKFETIEEGVQNMIAAAIYDYGQWMKPETVVNTDNDKKFKKGDLLKAAGFNAPARNAARGNVLEGNFQIRWTGPEYL